MTHKETIWRLQQLYPARIYEYAGTITRSPSWAWDMSDLESLKVISSDLQRYSITKKDQLRILELICDLKIGNKRGHRIDRPGFQEACDLLYHMNGRKRDTART